VRVEDQKYGPLGGLDGSVGDSRVLYQNSATATGERKWKQTYRKMPPTALTDLKVNQKKVGTGANQDKVSFNGDGGGVDRQSEDVSAANRRCFGGVRIINFEHAQIAG
jgi:hypothetical protein